MHASVKMEFASMKKEGRPSVLGHQKYLIFIFGVNY